MKKMIGARCRRPSPKLRESVWPSKKLLISFRDWCCRTGLNCGPLPYQGKVDLVGQAVGGLPTKAPTCRTQNGARYVAFLPAGLMSVLPLIFGGGGLATALLGFLPNLRSTALIGLAVLLGLAVIYGQIEKANYESEKAARASDNAAADHAALQQASAFDSISSRISIGPTNKESRG